MRLHYYQFPANTDHAILKEHGCGITSGCALNKDLDLKDAGFKCERGNCFEFERGRCTYECEHICVKEIEDTLSGISITSAKELLKNYGGAAWTYHIDRDGGIFETSAIKLKGNNSKFKYNAHL
jgi:hypothetical protein